MEERTHGFVPADLLSEVALRKSGGFVPRRLGKDAVVNGFVPRDGRRFSCVKNGFVPLPTVVEAVGFVPTVWRNDAEQWVRSVQMGAEKIRWSLGSFLKAVKIRWLVASFHRWADRVGWAKHGFVPAFCGIEGVRDVMGSFLADRCGARLAIGFVSPARMGAVW